MPAKSIVQQGKTIHRWLPSCAYTENSSSSGVSVGKPCCNQHRCHDSCCPLEWQVSIRGCFSRSISTMFHCQFALSILTSHCSLRRMAAFGVQLGGFLGKDVNENNDKKNIIIFGSAGTGKSSFINLIAGQTVADTSDSAIGCTFQSQNYEFENANLWDTAGLSEGADAAATITSADAISKLLRLVRRLRNGVSLLIMVIKKGRINENEPKNFRIFWEALCARAVPIMLVVTHCESNSKNGTTVNSWIQDAKNRTAVLEKFPGLEAPAICCVCTQFDSQYASMVDDAFFSRNQVMLMIQFCLGKDHPPLMIANDTKWLTRLFRSIATKTLGKIFGSSMKFASNNKMKKALVEAGMSNSDAIELTNELDKPLGPDDLLIG